MIRQALSFATRSTFRGLSSLKKDNGWLFTCVRGCKKNSKFFQSIEDKTND